MVQVGRKQHRYAIKMEGNMKSYWKKKLSAFLLALTLIVGLMPTALAADCGHSNWSSWQKLNDQQHQRTCLTSGCTGTQSANHQWSSVYEKDAASHWKKCADCGAQTTHEAHTYSGTMKYDSNNHWDQCSVCGYQDNLGGHVDLNSDGKCDTCGYSMGATTITVKFMNGTKVFKTQSVKKGSAPSAPGTPSKASSGGKSYTFKGWTTKNPGSTALYTGQTYLTSSQVSRTTLSADTTYYALYTVSGSSGDISYKVTAGESVTFSRSDFKKLYEDACGGSFEYVVFTPDSSYKSTYGSFYFDYEGTEEEKIAKSDMEDYEFDYSKTSDYPVGSLSFVAAEDASDHTITLDCVLYGDDEDVEATVTVKIGKGSSSSSKADLVLEVEPGEAVAFSRTDFKEFFEDEYDGDIFRSVIFTSSSNLTSSAGALYFDYDGKEEEKLSKSTLDDYEFEYSKTGDYPISKLSFLADKDADGELVTLEFTLYGDDETLDGVLEIRIGDVDTAAEKGDINYTVAAGDAVEFDRADFNQFFKEEYSKTLRYVTFYPDNAYKTANGAIYFDYDGKDEEKFSKTDLTDETFYYSSDDYGNYPLNELSFVADDDFDEALRLEFRAWYDEDTYVDGELVIAPEEEGGESSISGKGDADIRYFTTYSSSVQLNLNDFARFLKKSYPTSTLEYVKFTSVPVSDSLYYNYYGTSKYGGSKVRLTSDNCKNYKFYYSPDSTSEYALSELTFIPNGFNYCPSISFTAYGTGSKSVSGSILISVTLDTMGKVYGVTPKGTSVDFPASTISGVVSKGTGLSLGSIRLLTLPTASQGTVRLSNGTKADTSTLYAYSGSGSNTISNLQFVPASGFTGSVEIPYVAYNTSGNAIAMGSFSLGVMRSIPKFSDVSPSAWYYQYVVEMCDAGVINGFSNGTFQPNSNVTYGQALKLIMLAAGYPAQEKTGTHWASGYLTKAKNDKLISGTVDLDAPITRLAVAQLAAKAMKLGTSGLSSVKPFTDTSDVYVQALSAAGIVDGFFSGGTSTYRPSNTLTRGQAATIVWRMKNYNG